MSTTAPTDQTLVVLVSGGGPVGLTFSLHLAMMMGKNVKIIIYEGRWFVDQQGRTRWQGEEEGKSRRDQVVTLQDHVIEQMPEYIKKGLFQRINECVWPTSRNIPIREVEDRLFELIQPFVRAGQVELVTENLSEQSEHLINGEYDVLVGADGSTSFVRRYCNIQMISEGVEYACGVAYQIPDKVAPVDEPLHQAMNCILTVSQTRYLVNSSTSRRGYLNIRLIQGEYDELRERLQKFQARKEAIDLTDYDKCPQSPVWSIIRQGLEFFKIPSKYVVRVLPIEINVRHASIVVREVRFEVKATDSTAGTSQRHVYKTMLAFLVGDAAMNVHFWPGRGMNSGMKSAMSLARNILQACTANGAMRIRKPLRFLDFLDYEAFMARLRAREQQGRSLRVLINPIDPFIEASYSYAHLPHCYVRYTNKLLKKLQETRQRLQERPEWPHKTRVITDEELQSAVSRIAAPAVAQLSLANPWPTREMSGVEVLVEQAFPFDPKGFLPIPNMGHVPLERMPTTRSAPDRFVILWILGEKNFTKLDPLIKEIQTSPKFLKSTAGKESQYQLFVVETFDQAKDWLQNNRKVFDHTDVLFKIITSWQMGENLTAIDVIRAVRGELPRVPFLIFTNRREETQQASEYLNVMVADTEFELKEFVGLNQETQWSEGCAVARPQTPIGRPVESPGSARGGEPTPMLLWIDQSDNDVKARDGIAKAHPQLEMKFIPTYLEAEKYLRDHAVEIQYDKKLIVISRGYYKDDNKGFLDVADLLSRMQLSSKAFAVYTQSRATLLQRNTKIPDYIVIAERPSELIKFINEKLGK